MINYKKQEFGVVYVKFVSMLQKEVRGKNLWKTRQNVCGNGVHSFKRIVILIKLYGNENRRF